MFLVIPQLKRIRSGSGTYVHMHGIQLGAQAGSAPSPACLSNDSIKLRTGGLCSLPADEWRWHPCQDKKYKGIREVPPVPDVPLDGLRGRRKCRPGCIVLSLPLPSCPQILPQTSSIRSRASSNCPFASSSSYITCAPSEHETPAAARSPRSLPQLQRPRSRRSGSGTPP